MRYKLLTADTSRPLLERLFLVRGVHDDPQEFLDPSRATYRGDPLLLVDMQKAVNRTIVAMKTSQHIIILGDYDVDGVVSSFLLYTLFTHFFGYRDIEIMFPDRIEDGYGIKFKHLDICKKKKAGLVITVDNGITAVTEAIYARELGIDLIITDHHEPTDTIPDAFAVINPKLSPAYPCHDLCGAGVAYKFAVALLQSSRLIDTEKRRGLKYLLPLAAIATVADVVPLLGENRLIVKKGLEQINKREHLPPSLASFLDYLQLTGQIDTYHIGFVIGPRINAGGRIASPYDSLQTLLKTGTEQHTCLQALDQLNDARKALQEEAMVIAQQQLDLTKNVIIVSDPSFHEGVVGIVAGRLTETYNLPSLILKLDQEKKQAVGSLRGPAYFSVIAMLHELEPMLLRCGGHKQAGGLTVALDRVDELCAAIYAYCDRHISSTDREKIYLVDTELLSRERGAHTFTQLQQLGPYGEGNQEPTFLFRSCQLISCQKIGKNGNGHLKLQLDFGGNMIPGMYRGQGDMQKYYADTYHHTSCNIYGKIKKSTYDGSWFIDVVGIET